MHSGARLVRWGPAECTSPHSTTASKRRAKRPAPLVAARSPRWSAATGCDCANNAPRQGSGHGPARTADRCSPASSRSNRTTRSPRAGSWPRSSPGSRSSTPSRIRRRSTPTTAWSWSTRAACSRPSRCTTTMRRWSGEPARHRGLHARPHRPRASASTSTRRKRATNGWAPPRVVAHELVAERFDRYTLTAGYNAVINQRQFKAPGLRWPLDYRYPDETYRARPRARRRRRALRAPPRARRDRRRHVGVGRRSARCSSPATSSSGRRRTAATRRRCSATRATGRSAFRAMAALDAEVLLPGHGLPIVGADRVRQALTEGAELLESLLDQTLALMNEGARLDDIVHSGARARAPARPPVPPRRSTTSPSSSCATSGATTAAGTTAIRRT